jgi:hypothetical protein
MMLLLFKDKESKPHLCVGKYQRACGHLCLFKYIIRAGCQWLMPVILATQEAEIRRIAIQRQPRQIVCKTLSRKTLRKNRVGGVAQGEGPEFKP